VKRKRVAGLIRQRLGFESRGISERYFAISAAFFFTSSMPPT
jgi:hypothetical protein